MADTSGESRRLALHLEASDAKVAVFLGELRRFLTGNLRKTVEKIQAGGSDGREAAAALGSMMKQLEAAGLSEQVRKLRTAYAFELKQIEDTFRSLGAKKVFADVDSDVVKTLIEFDAEKVLRHVESDVADVKATLMRSVLVPGEQDLFDTVEDRMGKLEGNLTTELQTAVQAFNRTVTAKKAEELGFDLMLYVGPTDRITRPFCRKLLGRSPAIYTLKEIRAMDNESGLPVLEYAGGYNCRHHWRPVSAERAKALGYEA